eukprot:jgi/Mesvir1/23519/Mv18224-RA.2
MQRDAERASKAEGLKCTDVVVLLDREQGGAAHLESCGLRLHSVLRITQVAHVLLKHRRIDSTTVATIEDFVRENQTAPPPLASAPPAAAKDAAPAAGGDTTGAAAASAAAPTPKKGQKHANTVGDEDAGKAKKEKVARARLSYAELAEKATNAAARKLWGVMAAKKTNLCVAADVATCGELLDLAEKIGPEICVLKTHVDILEDFTPEFATSLREVADKHNFLLFEDRKFADIGNTVVSQYAGGIYKISEWADIVNAHIIPGPGIIDGLKSKGLAKGAGLLLLAEMSSEGTLARGSYVEECAKMAAAYPEFVIGFISQSAAEWPASAKLGGLDGCGTGLIHMTPGVQMQAGGDALGQQYNTPTSVITKNGSDIIIVGRGIIKARDPAEAAKEYRIAGWEAYCNSLSI